MKNYFLIGVLFTSSLVFSQHKYFTKTGSIHFEASVPSFEEVKASNETVSTILNAETGEIASLALIKGFRFKVALMEEHFNENYAETSKFPKATFSGKIEEFSMERLSESPTLFELIGTLTFHGKTVEIKPEISISLKRETIYFETNFILKPEDFDITIPKVLRKKVAEDVKVTINFELVPKS